MDSTQSKTQSPQIQPSTLNNPKKTFIINKKYLIVGVVIYAILMTLWAFVINPLVIEPAKMKMVLNYNYSSMRTIFINQFEESIGKSNIKIVENAFKQGKITLAKQLKETFGIQMLYDDEAKEQEQKEMLFKDSMNEQQKLQPQPQKQKQRKQKKIVETISEEELYPLNFKWPMEGATRISSGFGFRTDPFKRDIGGESLIGFHNGIDIMAPYGTKVLAALAGYVKEIGDDGTNGLGKYMFLDHGGGIESVYGHLSKIKVKEGQKVLEGQNISLSGSTGKSTGGHLHFGIRVNGKYVNPKKLFKRV